MARVSPVTSKKAATAATKVASKNPLMMLLGIGAIGAAAWMTNDTYKGLKPELERKYDNKVSMDNYQLAKRNHFQYSGQPGMDGYASRFRQLVTFGPFMLRYKFQQAKLYAQGIGDVLAQNMIPIGLAVGGAYAAFGTKNIHGIVRGFGRFMGSLMPKGWTKPVRDLFGKGFGHLGQGIKFAFQKAFSSPKSVALTLGALVFGSFTLDRFKKSYGNEGQDEFFRSQINGGE